MGEQFSFVAVEFTIVVRHAVSSGAVDGWADG